MQGKGIREEQWEKKETGIKGGSCMQKFCLLDQALCLIIAVCPIFSVTKVHGDSSDSTGNYGNSGAKHPKELGEGFPESGKTKSEWKDVAVSGSSHEKG